MALSSVIVIWILLPVPRSYSAIRVTPTLSTDFVRWSLSFMRNCTKSRFQQNTLALLQLALKSRAAMHALTARHPLQFDYRPSKKMVLYRDEAALEHARRRTAMKNQLGVGQEILSPAEAAAREPSLSELTSTFVGAIWSPMDEAGDARAFCCALAEMLRSEYDVKFLLNTEVVGFEKNRDRIVSLTTSKGNIESDYFVATLGIETRSLLRPLGIKLPLWPARGYSVTLPATAKAPTISLTDASRKIVFCRLGDCLRIAGGFEIGSWEQANSIVQPVRDLIERARAALPAAAEYGAEAHPWTGVRPITPSSQPIIGRSTVPRLYVNCGHGALGWTLAMGAADRLRSVLEEDAG